MGKHVPVYPISDEETVKRAKLPVEIALMEQNALRVPIIEYDPKSKKVFRLFNDGTKEEVNRDEYLNKLDHSIEQIHNGLSYKHNLIEVSKKET